MIRYQETRRIDVKLLPNEEGLELGDLGQPRLSY